MHMKTWIITEAVFSTGNGRSHCLTFHTCNLDLFIFSPYDVLCSKVEDPDSQIYYLPQTSTDTWCTFLALLSVSMLWMHDQPLWLLQNQSFLSRSLDVTSQHRTPSLIALRVKLPSIWFAEINYVAQQKRLFAWQHHCRLNHLIVVFCRKTYARETVRQWHGGLRNEWQRFCAAFVEFWQAEKNLLCLPASLI